MIIKQITVGHYEVFCYILGCEESLKAVVIDPGGEPEKIMAAVNSLGLEVGHIINTHFHADHTCGNAALRQATGAVVVMHAADAAMLRDQQAADYFAKQGFPLSLPADRLVEDGDIISMGNYAIRVIHTPGHSPGGICLYCDNNLFTGDSLFVGAAGRVDLPGGDFNTLVAALAEKIATLPPETVVWPGHDYGETTSSTIGREKKENPFLGGDW